MDGNQPRLVLCGSMSVYPRLREEQRCLEGLGIPAVAPAPEDNLPKDWTVDDFRAFKRNVSLHHFRDISHPLTFGILVVNTDKHGIPNYIGPNTFAEIAVAFFQGKRIYLFHDAPSNLAEELEAWGVVVLNGSIEKLLDDYHASCNGRDRQELTARWNSCHVDHPAIQHSAGLG